MNPLNPLPTRVFWYLDQIELSTYFLVVFCGYAILSIGEGETYKTLPEPNIMRKIKMDGYRATGLAEGWIEGTEEEVVCAWQYLHDSRLAYTMQGWFGRTAQALLSQGVIQ